MTVFFWALVSFNAAGLVITLAVSRASVFRNFAGAALNPLVIFVLLAVLFNLDFIYLFENPLVQVLESRAIESTSDVLYAYCVYSLFYLGALAGFVLAIARYEKLGVGFAKLAEDGEPAKLLAARILFASILIFAILMMSLQSGSDGNLSFQVISRENPAVGVVAWMLPMALCMLIAHSRCPVSKGSLLATSAAFLVLALSGGSRSAALVCAMVFLVAYSERRRLSAWLYALAIPVVGVFLAVSRYAFREQDFSGSFLQYLDEHGGLLSLFIASEEIAFAKIFASICSFAPELQLFPIQSVLALALAPIPRAIIPWKPLGSSAIFTSYFSPERWELTKSETLITGFGDAYWQFGTIGATIAIAVLGFVWISVCISLTNGPKSRLFEFLPLTLWCGYTFMRGDFFNVCLLLWSALFLVVLHRTLSSMLVAIGRAVPQFESRLKKLPTIGTTSPRRILVGRRGTPTSQRKWMTRLLRRF